MIALAKWYILNETLEKEQDLPLAIVLDRYEAQHGVNVASSDAVKRSVKLAKDFVEGGSVAGFTAGHQAEFERWLRGKGYADGYIGRIQGVVKAAVNRAFENGEIASAPFVKVISGDGERVGATIEQVAALFNADPPPHVFMAMMLMLNTLSRPGAVLDCRTSQADFKSRLLDLNPVGRKQTKKRRPVVPITDTLLPHLRMHEGQTYFVEWKERQVASIKSAWRKLALRAGVECDPYSLRHAMASELRRQSVPEWEVQGMLGHRTAGTTERYARFAPDYLGKASDAIDAYFHELQPRVKRELITNVVQLPKVKGGER